MAIRVGEVYVDLALNTKGYKKDLQRTIRSTETKLFTKQLGKTLSTSYNKSTNGILANNNKILNSFSSTFSSIKKILGISLSAYAVKSFTKSCLDAGSALQEIQNVVDVVYGTDPFTGLSKDVDKFTKSLIWSHGLSEKAAKEYMAYYGAMAESQGFATENAFEMSKTLTKLTGDMASFYDMSSDESYTKLMSIFTGETKTLKKIGIDISKVAMQEYMLANGIKKSYSELTRNEKVMLRYNLVLEQTQNAMGDFMRTSNSYANQTRILSLQWEQFKTNIGQGLISAITPAIKALNLLMEKMVQVSYTFKNFMESIFGKQTISSTGGGAIAGLTDSLESAEESAENTSKKLKTLLGFDQINRLDGKADTGGASSSLEDLLKIESATQDANEATDTFLSKFKGTIPEWFQLGKAIGNTITKWLDGIDWETAFVKAKDFGIKLAAFLNGLISPELFGSVGKTIANSINLSLKGALSFAKIFDWKEFGKSIGTGINDFVKNFDWVTFGQTVNEFIQGVKDAFFEAIKTINWKEVWKGIKDALGEIELSSWAFVIGTITIKKVGKWVLGGGIASSLKNIFSGLFDDVLSWSVDKFFTTKLGKKLLENSPKAMDVYNKNIAKTLSRKVPGLEKGLKKQTETISKKYSKMLGNLGKGTIAEKGAAAGKGAATGKGAASAGTLGGVAKTIGGIGLSAAGSAIAIKNFSDMLKNGFSWLDELPMIAGVAIAAVGAAILGIPGIVAAVGAVIIATIGTLIVNIKDDWEELKYHFSVIWQAIKQGVIDDWEELKSSLSVIWQAIMQGIKDDWEELKNNLSVIWQGVTQGVKDLGASISAWWNEKALPFLVGIKDSITNKWTEIKDGVVEKWTEIKERIGHFFEGIKIKANTFGTAVKKVLIDTWENIKTKLGDIWTNLKETATNTFNQLKSAIASPINAIIRMINKMISGINGINIDIPNWVPGEMGGKSLGFNIPTIQEISVPAYANGSYLKANTPKLAIVGDNRHEGEIVTPESKIGEQVEAKTAILTQKIERLEQNIANLVEVLATMNKPQPVYVQVGNEALDSYIAKAQDRNTLRTGGR